MKTITFDMTELPDTDSIAADNFPAPLFRRELADEYERLVKETFGHDEGDKFYIAECVEQCLNVHAYVLEGKFRKIIGDVGDAVDVWHNYNMFTSGAPWNPDDLALLFRLYFVKGGLVVAADVDGELFKDVIVTAFREHDCEIDIPDGITHFQKTHLFAKLFRPFCALHDISDEWFANAVDVKAVAGMVKNEMSLTKSLQQAREDILVSNGIEG